MPENSGDRAFPGLHYFDDTPRDQQLFFGREREVRELTEKILAGDVTILFGKSGDGKTSLVNAGLKPAFRRQDYLPVRARIFNIPKDVSPFQALYEAIEQEAPKSTIELPAGWKKETLWETFYSLQPTAENHLKPLVLILDQFEELFTLMAERKSDQEEFINQFADLARGRLPEELRERCRNRLNSLEPGSAETRKLEKLLYGSASPAVKILISLREDYLAYLDNLGKQIPKVYYSRYRLPPLSLEQAREAISNPPEQAVLGKNTFHIEKGAVDAILQFLTRQSSRLGISQEEIGPPQLQVLCRQLEEEMRQKRRNKITVEDLGGDKGMRRQLSRYYRGILKKFARLKIGYGPKRFIGIWGILRALLPFHFPRLAVRRLCEERLITAGGNRNSRHEDEVVHEIGVSEPNLETLVESRLIRREPRLKEAFYELSHDSLVPSLQTAGGIRKVWTLSARIIVAAALIIAGFLWGLPYTQSFFFMKNLRGELQAVQNGEIEVDYFRTQLERAKKIATDSTALAEINAEFDGWRKRSLRSEYMVIDFPNLGRADSLLRAVQGEYPHEEALISEFTDTLKERKIREVKTNYAEMVQTKDNQPPSAEILQKAKEYLDSTYIAQGKDVRITDLQADLAKRRGDLETQQQLLKEAERQRELSRNQLLSAIKIQKPAGTTVKGDTTGQGTKLEIELEPSPVLQNARVLLNGKEMWPDKTKEGLVYKGTIFIPAGAAKIDFEITAIDKEGNQASKRFNRAVDGIPPQLKTNKILYRDSQKEDWKPMPVNEWRGTFWRVEAKVSELLQSASLKIEFGSRQPPLYVNTNLTPSDRTLAVEGSNEKFQDGDRMVCSLKLKDEIGWENIIFLGDRKFIKTPPIPAKISLRKIPNKNLSSEEVKEMIKSYNFYHEQYNWKFKDPPFIKWGNKNGKGITHSFILQNEGNVVLDQATELFWQQSGSVDRLAIDDAQKFISNLNKQRFAGYSDWRLPTLEEAMSLLEPNKKSKLHIDAKFDNKQECIWTSDKDNYKGSWIVDFDFQITFHDLGDNVDKYYVRAVSDGIILLRKIPIKNLTSDKVKEMIQKYDFFCSSGYLWSNPTGKGIGNSFESSFIGDVIIDRATGLMWQKSGSEKGLVLPQAQNYIDDLNKRKFAGYSDWRLPTLEETMSLMVHEKNKDGLYIDPKFDKIQGLVWTVDSYGNHGVWFVNFRVGDCDNTGSLPYLPMGDYAVRAVRTGH